MEYPVFFEILSFLTTGSAHGAASCSFKRAHRPPFGLVKLTFFRCVEMGFPFDSLAFFFICWTRTLSFCFSVSSEDRSPSDSQIRGFLAFCVPYGVLALDLHLILDCGLGVSILILSLLGFFPLLAAQQTTFPSTQ